MIDPLESGFPFGYVHPFCYSGAYSILYNDTWKYQRIPGLVDPNTDWPPDPDLFVDGDGPYGRISPAATPVWSLPFPNTLWDYTESLWVRRTLLSPCGGTLRLQGFAENSAFFYVDGVLFAAVNFSNIQNFGIDFDVEVPPSLLTPGTHTIDILVLNEPDFGPFETDNTYFYIEAIGFTEVDSVNDVYADEVLADAPLLYMKFDDSLDGVALDSSGNGYHGSYVGGYSLGQTALIDRGSSAYFDGDSGGVLLPNYPALAVTGDLTIELLLNPDTFDGIRAYLATCAASGESEAANVTYLLQITPGGNLSFFHESGAGVDHNHSSTIPLPIGVVSHVVLERDDVNKLLKFYVNSILEETVAFTTSSSGGEDGVVSLFYSPVVGNREYAGLGDEVAIYDHLLGQVRIDAHYAATGL